MLLIILFLLALCHKILDDIAQTGAIKEGAGVLEDVLGAVVQDFANEKLQQTVYFGVLPEVPLISHPQLKLLLFDLILLCSQNSLHPDEIVIIFKYIIAVS